MKPNEPEIDWSLTTWEGSRRAQLRDAMKLSLIEKWQAVEEMTDWARATIESRRGRGLAYINPYTEKLSLERGTVREDRPHLILIPEFLKLVVASKSFPRSSSLTRRLRPDAVVR
jgi:hypothetical protein